MHELGKYMQANESDVIHRYTLDACGKNTLIVTGLIYDGEVSFRHRNRITIFTHTTY